MRRYAFLILPFVALFLWAAPASASTKDAVLVGDSLMLSLTEEAPSDLGGWTVTLNAAGGTGLTKDTPAALAGATWDWPTGLAALETKLDPGVVVITLGTNDSTDVNAGEDYGLQIDRMLAATDAPVVYWSTCSTHTPWANIASACAIINADLVEATKRHPTLHLIDYDNLITTHPENIGSDGIHLSDLGQQNYADLIAATVGPAPK